MPAESFTPGAMSADEAQRHLHVYFLVLIDSLKVDMSTAPERVYLNVPQQDRLFLPSTSIVRWKHGSFQLELVVKGVMVQPPVGCAGFSPPNDPGVLAEFRRRRLAPCSCTALSLISICIVFQNMDHPRPDDPPIKKNSNIVCQSAY
jgi:hypothetical protein